MTSGTSFKPTEIVLIPFPFTDLSALKRRPVLILTAPDRFNDFMGIPLTSQNKHENSINLLKSDLLKGELPKSSWVRTDKIFTFNTEIIIGRIAQLKTEVFANIKNNVCTSLGCCE
jgi:mRNA interferase MazF